MIFHDIEQNTEKWFALRVGLLTGSSAKLVMAKVGKPFGAPADRLAVKIAREIVTGRAADVKTFSNVHTERGHIEEPLAIALYEKWGDEEVKRGGFFEGEGIGCSPDGRVFGFGLIEVKSVLEHIHNKTVERGKFDPVYKWQLYFNMWATGAAYIDFISYCGTLREGGDIYIDTISAADSTEEFKLLDERVNEFLTVVAYYVGLINSGEMLAIPLPPPATKLRKL